MPGLGSKESFYLDLVRDAWGPLTARREVRQAWWVFAIGLFCVGGGGYAMLVSADFTPFVAGLAFTGWAANTLWPYRGAVRAWRRIGPVRLECAAGGLVAGELGTFELVVLPRRNGVVRASAITIWAKDSRGPSASAPWSQGLVFDADPAAMPPLVRGVERRLPVLVALDPSAPPSRFERDYVRQWMLKAELTLDDGRQWVREYPVLVYPGTVVPTTATTGTGTPEA